MSKRATLALLFVLLVSPVSAQSLEARMDEVLTAYHEAGQLNGSVLVARGDEVVFARGYGEADMRWHIPNAPDTRFRIGSVTKQFTSALVLQLVEEGKLDLDDTLSEMVPDYPAAQGNLVTLHQLLNHTSGIPSYTSIPGFFEGPARNPLSTDSLAKLTAYQPLEFEPGSEWRYNNSGYVILGLIVERVTGMSYEDALQERILEPLGLSDTGYDDYLDVRERMASGYSTNGFAVRTAPYLDTSLPHAAGMLYSTVGDLHRWALALADARVFKSAATRDLMWTPGLQNYGYGVGISTAEYGGDSLRVVQHSGGIHGFTAFLRVLPEQRVVVAVLDNTGGPTGTITEAATRVFFGDTVELPGIPVATAMLPRVESDGVSAAIEWYLSVRESTDFAFDEGQLNRLGYYILQEGHLQDALTIFELNIAQYPEAANPYDSYGEALMMAGRTEESIANYRKSLELNPGNNGAIARLAEMGAPWEAKGPEVSEEEMDRLTGGYQLAPGFVLTIRKDGAQLFAQATGQPENEIFPQTATRWFFQVVEAQLEFRIGDDGQADQLTLFQGGQVIPGARVE